MWAIYFLGIKGKEESESLKLLTALNYQVAYFYTRAAYFYNLTRTLYRAVFTWLSKGIGFGFGFGFTTPFGWLVYLLWFWFYDSQVKTALCMWPKWNMLKLTSCSKSCWCSTAKSGSVPWSLEDTCAWGTFCLVAKQAGTTWSKATKWGCLEKAIKLTYIFFFSFKNGWFVFYSYQTNIRVNRIWLRMSLACNAKHAHQFLL